MSRTIEAAHLYTIETDDYHNHVTGGVTISETHGGYPHLTFKHHNAAGSAQTLAALLDRAWGHGYQTRMREETNLSRDTYIPMPGEKIEGDTVVASVEINETDDGEVYSMALLLTSTPGAFYRIVNLLGRTVESEIGTYPNIVPAVEAYVDNGGDY